MRTHSTLYLISPWQEIRGRNLASLAQAAAEATSPGCHVATCLLHVKTRQCWERGWGLGHDTHLNNSIFIRFTGRLCGAGTHEDRPAAPQVRSPLQGGQLDIESWCQKKSTVFPEPVVSSRAWQNSEKCCFRSSVG